MIYPLFLALVVAAPALKDKPRPAAASVVGEWAIESAVVGGSTQNDIPNRWVFHADGTRQILNGDKTIASGTYAIDPKADPASIDLDPGAASGVYPCIYRLDGDTLTVNVGWQKSDRPTKFESAPGSQCTLYVFKRVKKD
jgi:uncharacterized protein (TIGR03067 family)